MTLLFCPIKNRSVETYLGASAHRSCEVLLCLFVSADHQAVQLTALGHVFLRESLFSQFVEAERGQIVCAEIIDSRNPVTAYREVRVPAVRDRVVFEILYIDYYLVFVS